MFTPHDLHGYYVGPFIIENSNIEIVKGSFLFFPDNGFCIIVEC